MGTTSSAADVLAAIAATLSARLQEVLAAENCSLDEWRVMDYLAAGEPQTMTAISEQCRLSPPVLSKVVDRLVANNIVYRRNDSADRRRINIRLTPRGHAAYRMLRESVDRVDYLFDQESRDLLGRLGRDGQDLLSRLGAPAAHSSLAL